MVQGEREGQRNGGDRVIPVIADVRRAWHDAAPDLSYLYTAHTSLLASASEWA